MTNEPGTSPTEESSVPGSDALAELTAVLADVLHVAPDRIDPQQPFQLLGLDSLLTVEFVSAVNTRFGTQLAAAVLYDHPTPAELARLVAAEHAGPAATATDRGTFDPPAVLDALRRQLARILHCDPWEIDPDAPFPQLGLDSILSTEFVSGINQAYGLTERPVTLYDHPSLAAMAEHVASCASHVPAPVTAVQQAPAPAAQQALSTDEVNALLDAVRGNLLSIDEAVALLAARTV